MQADLEDMDFMQRMEAMLGMDEKKVEAVIDELSADQLTELADAVANEDRARAESIIGATDEDVNPLFRGENVRAKARKRKHRRRVAPNYEFNFGDDVHVKVTDPETKRTSFKDGTVYIPNGPDDTVGVKIDGQTKMVDRRKVRKLEEGVLGMVNLPSLDRMQRLAGIHGGQSHVEPDEGSAADQAMEAIDLIARVLPDVRLADLKVIRQRLLALQTSMNECIAPDHL